MTDSGLRLGVTGHQDLPSEVVALVAARLDDFLADPDGVTAITSLARGADQVVARAVLDRGGDLEVVVPCEGYGELFVGSDASSYDELLARASSTTRLPYPEPSESAFLAAGLVVVERCDRLLAVWDGEPARGLGGTADVVAYARSIERALVRVWRTVD